MTSFRTAYTLTTNYSLTLITTTTLITKSVLSKSVSFVTFVPPFMFTNETEVHGERKTARESKFYAEIK